MDHAGIRLGLVRTVLNGKHTCVRRGPRNKRPGFAVDDGRKRDVFGERCGSIECCTGYNFLAHKRFDAFDIPRDDHGHAIGQMRIVKRKVKSHAQRAVMDRRSGVRVGKEIGNRAVPADGGALMQRFDRRNRDRHRFSDRCKPIGKHGDNIGISAVDRL